MKVTIYALCEPDSEVIRYVGKTKNDVYKRYKEHLKEEGSSLKVRWVKNLLKKRMPLIVRLIHGMPPKGLKSSFVPEFRLLGFIEVENNIFAF